MTRHPPPRRADPLSTVQETRLPIRARAGEWLSQGLEAFSQALIAQGAAEIILMQGRLSLDPALALSVEPGRWLLARFPAAPHEPPRLLAVVVPLKGESHV